jgi:hypothetical protein
MTARQRPALGRLMPGIFSRTHCDTFQKVICDEGYWSDSAEKNSPVVHDGDWYNKDNYENEPATQDNCPPLKR